MSQLLYVCCAHLFGRSAYKRLAFLFCITALGGGFIGIMIGKSIDAPPQSINRLGLSFLFAAQLTTIALCLPLAIHKFGDTLPMLGRIIPFSQLQISFIRAFPGLVVLSLSLIGLAWPAVSIGNALGLAPLATLVMLIIGSISGWSIVYMMLGLPKYKSLLLSLILVSCEFMLVRAINQTYSPLPFIIILGIIIDLTIFGAPFFAKQPVHRSWYRNTNRISWRFSHHLWWVAKMWRNRRTKIGFMTVLIASCITVAFGMYAHALELGFITPVITLLAASFACDLRPLARLEHPCEITGLRGSLYFVKTIVLNGLAVCVVGLLPLLIAFTATIPPPQDIALIFTSLLLGYAIGLWVSFLLVPQSQDPLGQVLAVGLASVLLFSLGKLPFIAQGDTTTKILACISLAIVAIAHCGIIEYKRNRFLWRRRNV